MTDLWAPIPGYEGLYEVSDLGNVRSRRGLLKPCVWAGYRVVRPYKGGGARTCKVADLVMAAFVGPKPKGLETRHWNDIRTDDRLSNLLYGSRKQNVEDAIRNGVFGGGVANARKTRCPKGHEYTTENTRLHRGSRECRRCQADYAAARRRKRAA